MFKGLNTRNRAIFTAVFTGMLLFVFISPVTKFVSEFISQPSDVKNIKVAQKNREVDISWTRNTEFDLKGYHIFLDDQEIKDPKLDSVSTENFQIYDLDNGVQHTIKIQAYDSLKKVSNPVEFKVKLDDQTATSFSLNEYDEDSFNLRNILLTTFVIAAVLFLLNIWVLFFKLNRKTLFTIGAFPAVSVAPYLILTLSVLITINSQLNRLIFSFGISMAFIIITYLLTLTTNIINGSFFMQLPLEQAAKASQFIFGLISTYLMFVYVFSSNFAITTRLIILLSFVFYFTFSCISVLKSITQQEAYIRSIVITLVMAVGVFIISIWPIDSVYAILSLAVVYYVLLNITLEIRKQVGRGVWIEYSILLFLILFLLLTNSFWGIKGSII